MGRLKGPTLKFGKTTESVGFSGFKTASFSDLRSARIVREILQNSLDAALLDAGEETAVVRFRVRRSRADDVPDLHGYEQAFQAAVAHHRAIHDGELPDAAQQVVESIESAIAEVREGTHYSLSVLDNGVGLDKRRMMSILGDGSSVKSSAEAAGSYGVGHLAAISASDLRYVLYGGVLENGRRTAAGCAILASRSGAKSPVSAYGYLIDSFLSGKRGQLYKFVKSESIPGVVSEDLEEIRSEWGHGTAVVILAFNYFGDWSHWLWDIVSKVAAYNFAPAVFRGDLVIEVDEDDLRGEGEEEGVRRLDTSALEEILEQDRERVYVARSDSAFAGLRPAGRDAYAAYLTLRNGQQSRVRTRFGEMEVWLETPAPAGSTRVDLYRNGMWITDDVVGLGPAEFAEQVPFHAVVVPVQGQEFHRLIRKAEGPMHDELAISRLGEQDRESLEAAIGELATWIRSRVPKHEMDEYTPDDFLVVERGGEGRGGGRLQYSMWGTPVVVHKARLSQRRLASVNDAETEHEGERGKRRKRRRKTSARKPSKPLPFQCTVVPDGSGRLIVALECNEEFEDVLFSLRVDENSDATCDRIWPDEEVAIESFEIASEEKPPPVGVLGDGGRTVRVKGLLAGKKCKVIVRYASPEGLVDAVTLPIFRVDLHKPLDEEEESEASDGT